MSIMDKSLTTKAMRCLATLDEVPESAKYRGYIVGEGFFDSRAEVDRYIEASSVPGAGLQELFAKHGVNGVYR